MVAVPKSGVLETTNTTGTGAYTLAGATAGYRAFSAADTGLQFHYAVRTATQFEVSIGTYTHSTRQLTRDIVIANHSNNTTPINWGVGTKEVAIVLIAERVAMTDVENIWRSQQYFRGNSLWLDADDDTGFVTSSDDQVRYMAGGVEFLNLDFANKQIRAVMDDPGASAGPGFQMLRTSASPAPNDVTGFIQFSGKDSAAATVTYNFIYSQIENATAGATSGRMVLQAISGGTVRNALSVRGFALTAETGVSIFTAGKATQSTNTVGVELNSTGYGEFVTQDAACLFLNRKGSDGQLIDVRRDNVSVASVSVAADVVTWGTFTGSHDSEWASSVQNGEDFEERGMVVCAAPGMFGDRDHLPLCRPSGFAADRAVYGVVADRSQRTSDDGNGPLTRLLIAALGTHPVRVTGPVKIGDLLETSDLAGVARAQADDVLRSSTLGKVVQDSPDDGTIRLVPAVLYAG